MLMVLFSRIVLLERFRADLWLGSSSATYNVGHPEPRFPHSQAWFSLSVMCRWRSGGKPGLASSEAAVVAHRPAGAVEGGVSRRRWLPREMPLLLGAGSIQTPAHLTGSHCDLQASVQCGRAAGSGSAPCAFASQLSAPCRLWVPASFPLGLSFPLNSIL